MDSKQFLKEMLEAGQRWIGGGGAGIVSQVKVEIGVHRYVTGHDFWSFWKAAANKDDLARVGEEVEARLREAGCNDKPMLGIKVTIHKDVLSRDTPYKAHLQEFVPAWQADAFELLVNHINEANLPFNEWFWGKVEYKANPYFVKQGEAGKKETDQNGNPRYPSIRVPVEKYANEAAARAAVGGSSTSTSAADNSQWSDTARKNYKDDLDDLAALASEVSEWYTKMVSGTPFANDAETYPLPTPLTPPAIKQKLAGYYDVETADIDLLMSLDVAF